MDAVRKAEKRGDVSLDLQLVRDEMMSSVPLLNRIMMKLGWTTRLQNFIKQAGMETKPGKILLFSGVSGLSAYVIVSVFYGQFSLGLIAAAVGAAIPLLVIGSGAAGDSSNSSSAFRKRWTCWGAPFAPATRLPLDWKWSRRNRRNR